MLRQCRTCGTCLGLEEARSLADRDATRSLRVTRRPSPPSDRCVGHRGGKGLRTPSRIRSASCACARPLRRASGAPPPCCPGTTPARDAIRQRDQGVRDPSSLTGPTSRNVFRRRWHFIDGFWPWKRNWKPSAGERNPRSSCPRDGRTGRRRACEEHLCDRDQIPSAGPRRGSQGSHVRSRRVGWRQRPSRRLNNAPTGVD